MKNGVRKLCRGSSQAGTTQHPSITNREKGDENYFNKVSLCTVLCIKFSSSQSLMILDDKNVTFLLVQRRTVFHREISSPAFKKRKEDVSLSSYNALATACLQPVRNHLKFELLFFSSEQQPSPIFS